MLEFPSSTTVLAVLSLCVAGCVVSTETVPGESGPQGSPGPKGDSPWISEGDEIYYADPVTQEKLAIISNEYPQSLQASSETVSLGGVLSPSGQGHLFKLGLGRTEEGESCAAVGVEWDGAQASMVFGVAGAPGDGANWNALRIGKYGVVEMSSNMVVHGSFALTGTDGNGTAYMFSSQADGANDIGFYTGGASGVERLTITSEGYVGIGETSPTSLLTVGGDARATRILVDASTYVSRSAVADGGEDFGIYTSGAERLSISNAGNVVIQPANSGFDLAVAGSLDAGAYYLNKNTCMMNCPSDARLKKNVAPLTGALDLLLRLRGVTYDWLDPQKHGSAGPQNGFIAQEVETVFPEWVGTNKDGYKTLIIRGFEALAVESLRELKKKNESLEGRVSELIERLAQEKAEREKLEARLTALEARLGGSSNGANQPLLRSNGR